VLMGRKKRPWQDVDYVLSYFGDTPRRAKKEYVSYVGASLDQGRRKELTGGGLIRSLGGWAEVRKHGLRGQDHIKSDERILGESDFVDDILSQASEKYERKYELKRLGYDLDQVAARVADIHGIEVDEIFLKGKQQIRVKARSLFCFWAVQELGITPPNESKNDIPILNYQQSSRKYNKINQLTNNSTGHEKAVPVNSALNRPASAGDGNRKAATTTR
jgi:hypothetical protein